ncbi:MULTISPECIES: hypothetical protein [unclassified Bradyrhizobium]|uniref:COG3904 family protein n=1 Tax=unclassified Bradyrhizobium TaxID=2631580 RepID=UPI0028EC201B|nr:MULTISPECIES: hypothetical protein [unclassified Bradyrhizobium]
MRAAVSDRVHTWLAGNPDESILRWIFRLVLVVAISALAADLAERAGWVASSDPLSQTEVREDTPITGSPSDSPSILAPLIKRLIPLPQPDPALARPITFELGGGGRLLATGTITAGSSQAFAAEVERHGEYIKTVVLNSPGGSVADALAMGRLIRGRNFATEVEAGKYCASSCPLVLAGGTERRAGERAVIGVQQVAAGRSANAATRDEMSVAQNISARVERYLADMGVKLDVWMHAMETPHDKLFIFKPEELKALNLVTSGPNSAPEKART